MTDESVLKAISGSNLYTLCDQYGLDSAQIEATVAHLGLIRGKTTQFAPFLLLRYHPKGDRPLLVHAFQVDSSQGSLILHRAVNNTYHPALKKALGKTNQVLFIELSQIQLRDMGLLLAYEVARWAAEQGKGFVRGLDGKWYRLNGHQAFIPFEGYEPSD